MRWIPLLLLLAACGGSSGPELASAGPPADPNTAACQTEAEKDPDVEAARRRLTFGKGYYSVAEADLRAAQKEAVRTCLQRRGIAPRGGVERETRWQ